MVSPPEHTERPAPAAAWQAIVPELVPRAQLSAAIALNSVGVNISRAIGPALAGIVIATAGPGLAFAVNAVSFLAVVVVLARWRRRPRASELPPEHFLTAMAGGVRYVRHSPRLMAVLVRSFAFAFFAVALWALLPLATRQLLGAGARGYGVLLACIGLGAVAGAIVLPPLRARLSPNALTLGATAAYAAVLHALSLAPPFWAAALMMMPAGLAWIAMLSTLNASAHFLLPAWVRARGLSVSLAVFFGSMALGAIAWGALAGRVGLPVALTVAAAGLVLGAASALRFHLPRGEGPNLSPSKHWPAPHVPDTAPDAERGPVMVTVEYHITDQTRDAFLRAAREMRRIRLRDGALTWELYEDPAARGRFVETFVNRNWSDHLRMHERVTNDDLGAEASLRRHHSGDEPPRVTHLVSSRGQSIED